MSVNVMLAFANMLFSEGISKLLESETEIKIAEILKSGSGCSIEKLEAADPDIILVDFTTLYNSFPDLDNAKKKYHFILLDTNCGMDNLVSAFLKKKVSGVLLNQSSSSLLKKAVRAVSKGEIWIDKQTFKNLLQGINAISKEKNDILSGREKEIVGLIGEGFRNKEIARRLNISEPTVKTHLSRIFQKLHVRTRSELISYAIKNNDINNGFFHSRV